MTDELLSIESEIGSMSETLREIDTFMTNNSISLDPSIPFSFLARQVAINANLQPVNLSDREYLARITEEIANIIVEREQLLQRLAELQNSNADQAEINLLIASINEKTDRNNYLVAESDLIVAIINRFAEATRHYNSIIALKNLAVSLDHRLRANRRLLIATNSDADLIVAYDNVIRDFEQLTLNPNFNKITLELDFNTSNYLLNNYNIAHLNIVSNGSFMPIDTTNSGIAGRIEASEITEYNLGISRFNGPARIDSPNSDTYWINTSNNVVIPGGSEYLTDLALSITAGIVGTENQAASLNYAMFENVEYCNTGWVTGSNQSDKDIFGTEIIQPFYNVFLNGQGECEARAIYFSSLLNALHIPNVFYFKPLHIGVAVQGVPQNENYTRITAFDTDYYILESTQAEEVNFVYDPAR